MGQGQEIALSQRRLRREGANNLLRGLFRGGQSDPTGERKVA